MPLVSSLPLAQSGPWSSFVPQQALELITTFNTDELLSFQRPPTADLAWTSRGTHTSVGEGIVKVVHNMPQTASMVEFISGNARKYHHIDVIAKTIKLTPRELSYEIPMIWSQIGNGWKLMSNSVDGTLMEFAGITNLGATYVTSGRVEMGRFAANLFYTSLYATTGGLNLTAPTQTTYPQGLSPLGIALFSDGTGADGTVGAQHYANPTVQTSGRFKNVYFGFGSFAANYGSSLALMTVKPNPLFPDITNAGRVTDTFGPTGMRDQFWRMAIQDLVLQAQQIGGSAVGAATTNPYAYAKTLGITEENFIGAAFGPRTFHIVPHLNNHPYLQQNPTADFWINVDARPDVGSWAQLACNTKTWTPVFRMYGPGDPQAQRNRMMRWEGDLDGGGEPGNPANIDMFGSV